MNHWLLNHLKQTTEEIDTVPDTCRPSLWRRIFTGLRRPDLVIGEDYLLRWHLIPRNNWFNIYLHCFIGDDDVIMHDHPWRSVSFLLKGQLNEVRPHQLSPNVLFDDPNGYGYAPSDSQATIKILPIVRFLPKYRSTEYIHRIMVNKLYSEEAVDVIHYAGGELDLIPRNHAWTLFITGRITRRWGFHCPKGFVDFRKYFDGGHRCD